MNGRLELCIITQPYSEVYWGYFRRLVFGNSLTKHNKLTSFSYSAVICFLPFTHIPLCYHAKPPDFPHLFRPRAIGLCGCGTSTGVQSHKNRMTQYHCDVQTYSPFILEMSKIADEYILQMHIIFREIYHWVTVFVLQCMATLRWVFWCVWNDLQDKGDISETNTYYHLQFT